MKERTIYVYENWSEEKPVLIGRLYVCHVRGKEQFAFEYDYLLGVYDKSRMGALRFKTEESGAFLSGDEELATPPWTTLRTLEAASLGFENDESGLEERWLKQLLAPGSSLGGARPKATVQDEKGNLWIAKFPSKHDEVNSGACEYMKPAFDVCV